MPVRTDSRFRRVRSSPLRIAGEGLGQVGGMDTEAGPRPTDAWRGSLRPRLTAVQRFAVSLAVLLLALAGTVTAALSPPWLGLRLAPDAERDTIVVTSVRAEAPAAAARPGETLRAVSGAAGRIELAASDLIEEPDGLETYAAYDDFFGRQERIRALLASDQARLHLQAGGDERTIAVRPAPSRPFLDLPFAFWFQLACAAIIGVIGSWVASLRRGDRQAAYFAFAGYGCIISILSAAIYSTRELALDGQWFRALSAANHAGAMTFAIFMIGLFTIYPKRLGLERLFQAAAIILSLWWLANMLQLLPDITAGFYLAILAAMIIIIGLIGVQYRAARHDLPARKALAWLGVSVLVGAGAFSALMALPIVLRYEAALSQAYSFGFFPLIYLGVALGLTRYRLFELDRWAFDVLSYIVAVVLFLAVDVALVSLLTLNLQTSLGITALLVGLIYLPVRNWASSRVLAARQPDTFELFRSAAEIALQPTREARAERWRMALVDHFEPLAAEPCGFAGAHPAAAEEGLALDVPAYDWSPPLRLSHMARGRRLFGRPHAATVERLAALVAEAEQNRRAYDRGVSEERRRIGRDLHDNVGAMLLSSLRAPDAVSSRDMVRGALTDIREIVNGLSDRAQPLSHIVAHLRAETTERLAGLEVDWPLGAADDSAATLPYAIYRGFTSAHRELVSNVLRHADARTVRIETRIEGGLLVHVVGNDLGPAAGAHTAGLGGNGLANLAQRAAELGGGFAFERGEAGARAEIRLPLAAGGTA